MSFPIKILVYLTKTQRFDYFHFFSFIENVLDCAYKRPEDRTSSLMIAAYVMAGICGVCVIPLILLIVQWIYLKLRQKSAHANDSNIETADINNLLPETNDNIDEAVSDGSR